MLLVYAPWLDEQVGQYLLAPKLFADLFELFHADPRLVVPMLPTGGVRSLPPGQLVAATTGGGFGGSATITNLNTFDLQRVGIALEALLWAFLGGWIARYFASGRDPATTSQPEPPKA